MDIKKENRPSMRISGIVLDCPDAEDLAAFYQNLLGWENTHSGDGWAGLTAPDGTILALQTVEDYQPPVWPWKKGTQGQMMHFDLMVENLEKAVEYAVFCGAKIAGTQYYQTSKTMFDPAGHTFCLDTAQAE